MAKKDEVLNSGAKGNPHAADKRPIGERIPGMAARQARIKAQQDKALLEQEKINERARASTPDVSPGA